MNCTDNTQEAEQSVTASETASIAKEASQEEVQAPLIRYFTILDESTESYVLGYN